MKHGESKNGLGGDQFTEPKSAIPSFLGVGLAYPVLASNLVHGYVPHVPSASKG